MENSRASWVMESLKAPHHPGGKIFTHSFKEVFNTLPNYTVFPSQNHFLFIFHGLSFSSPFLSLSLPPSLPSASLPPLALPSSLSVSSFFPSCVLERQAQCIFCTSQTKDTTCPPSPVNQAPCRWGERPRQECHGGGR